MFTSGSRYVDQRGRYEVLVVLGVGLLVRYDDGGIEVIDIEVARTNLQAALETAEWQEASDTTEDRTVGSGQNAFDTDWSLAIPTRHGHGYWRGGRHRTRRPNVCWVCHREVSEDNQRCTCTWWICDRCLACMCPDWFDGKRARRPECQEQIQRLGRVRYDALVAQRCGERGQVQEADYLEDLPF